MTRQRTLSTRRDFLKTLGLASALAGTSSFQQRCQVRENPNIILIMADDLGYAELSCCGSLSNATPVLDHLAETGIFFSQCYSTPLCTLSHVQLMNARLGRQRYWIFCDYSPRWGSGNLRGRSRLPV